MEDEQIEKEYWNSLRDEACSKWGLSNTLTEVL